MVDYHITNKLNVQKGRTAEHVLRAQLEYMGQATIRMPEGHVYDVQNATNNTQIEVKSCLVKTTQSNNKLYSWELRDNQLENKTLDYFVLIGFNDINNPFDFISIVVPQDAVLQMIEIRENGQVDNFKVSRRHISYSVNNSPHQCNAVALGLNRYDLLTNPSRRSATYHKNKLTKQMLKMIKDYYLLNDKNIIRISKKDRVKTQDNNYKSYKCKCCTYAGKPLTGTRVAMVNHIQTERHKKNIKN
jgi:hypothetical protein